MVRARAELEKGKQRALLIQNSTSVLCLPCHSACLALTYDGFVPREGPTVLVETLLRSALFQVLVEMCENKQTSYLLVTNKQLNFCT